MLDNIKTIVLLMFENRSFDHMLGHLSYDGINPKVDGLLKPLQQYPNIVDTVPYFPFRFDVDVELPKDLPHEMQWVKEQLNKSPASGLFQMDGFVKAYSNFTGISAGPKADPIGFFGQEHIPVTSSLAANFCTCDRWFAPLPTSTQPNRTMAFCGDTSVADTKFRPIPSTGNIFDWLTNAEVRWRVYHDALSIFILYPDLLRRFVFGPNFRSYDYMFSDFQSEPDASFPQVILVEPSYQDAPHLGSMQPNDNHPPLAVGFGEDFLRRTYQAVTVNPERWGNTLLLVYYDEHGGFFDHVPPPSIGYRVLDPAGTQFDSLGVRVPAILISPYVAKRSVSHLLFDHTSVLQMLAEKFTPGTPYSTTVAERKAAGINSLSAALAPTADMDVPAIHAAPIVAKATLGDSVAFAPDGDMAKAFESAALEMMANHADQTREKFPQLFQWKDAAKTARPSPADPGT